MTHTVSVANESSQSGVPPRGLPQPLEIIATSEGTISSWPRLLPSPLSLNFKSSFSRFASGKPATAAKLKFPGVKAKTEGWGSENGLLSVAWKVLDEFSFAEDTEDILRRQN